MKKFNLLFLLFFLTNFSFGQNEMKEKIHPHELGLNLTSLVDRFFLKAANNNAIFSSYILNYRKHGEKNTFRLHVGGGGSFFNKKPAPFSERNRKSESLSTSLAIGLEKYYAFNDRFKMNYGADVIYSFNYRLTTSESESGEFPEKTSNRHTVGGQLIAGFQFAILPRLIVRSESGYRLSLQTEKTNFSFINENNDRSENEKSGSTFFAPSTGIFLSFLF